jgi:MFS family permease
VPLVLLMVRDRPNVGEDTAYATGGAALPSHHGHGRGADGLGWREVMARKNFWMLVGIFLPIGALHSACMQIIAPYAVSHGLSVQAGAALLSLLAMMGVIATVGLGLLSDRFGNRLPFAGLAVTMITGAVLLAVGSSLSVIVAACALIGLSGGVFSLLAAAVAVEFGAEGVGRAFGLCMLFIPLMAFGAFGVAKTHERTGSYAPAFIAMAMLVVISAFLSLKLRERNGVTAVAVT